MQQTFKKSLMSSCIAAVTIGSLSTTLYAEEASDAVQEIVVSGIRASLTRAIDVKRESGSIVDSISAEDIGKLPDNTIADSLQRVTGVQITRSAGEGGRANVRGLPQVAIQLNGEQFLSATSITTVQPDFSDIPAELLSGVDVMKSSEAKTLSGGVAGTINLKTRRPLDLKDGWTLVGSAEGTDGSYTDKMGTKFSGFAGFHDEDFGALVSVTKSYSELANFRYGMFNDWWFRGYHENSNWPSSGVDLTRDGDTNDTVLGTIDYGVTDKTSVRDRTGISGSFQYKMSDKVELLADVFYTKMTDKNHTNGVVADNAWGQWDWITPGQLTNHGKPIRGNTDSDFYTTSTFTLNAPRVTAKAESQVFDRDSTNINLQANIEFTDAFKGSVRYLHGDANQTVINDVADAFITSGAQQDMYSYKGGVKTLGNPGGEGPGRIVIKGDMTGTYPKFTYPAGFGDKMSKYALVSTYSEHNQDDQASLDTLRFDGTWSFDQGSFDFGYREGRRDIDSVNFDYAAPFTRDDGTGKMKTAYAKWKDTGGRIAGSQGDTIGEYQPFTKLNSMGYIISKSNFGPASTGESYFFIDPKVMDDAYKFQESLYPGNAKITSWPNSFKVHEETHTAYFQANMVGEFALPYKANFGLQAVQTLMDITSYAQGDADHTTVNGKTENAIFGAPAVYQSTSVVSRDDLDLLPRLNIAFDVAENQKVRFSYTKTLTSLDANDLGRGTTYTTNYDPALSVFRVVGGKTDGNPNLAPWRSNNYDLSYEWYFDDASLVSIGLYRLEIQSSITNVTTKKVLADLDGVIRNKDGVDYTTKANAPGSVNQGFEVSYQQAYDFLPGVFSGLGSTLNYTYSQSESGDKDFYGKTMPMGDNSKNQFNAILWYQKDAWQARIAYNYRSERYRGISWNDGSPAAWWTAPTAYVDASVSYDINDHLTAYLQGTNITKEFEHTYMQWSDVMLNQSVFEARYTLGVRAKF